MPGSAAIVVGGYINGLGVVRALAARGVRVAVITTQPFDIAHRSRYVAAHRHAPSGNPDRLIDCLTEMLHEWRDAVVFPTNDDAMAVLHAHRESLSTMYRLPLPPPEVVPVLLDKSSMHGKAAAAGLDVPQSYGPADAGNRRLADVRLPVVIKPRCGTDFQARFGTKLFAVRDQVSLERSLAAMRSSGGAGDVYELIEGADDRIAAYCLFIDRHGEPSAGVQIRKRRQGPPFFGIARVAEFMPTVPELREASVSLLRHIGFRGMAAVEFKQRAGDERWSFIEVNGRSVVYNALLRRGGHDLAGMAWSELAVGRAVPAQPNDWRGAWINLHADLLYSVQYRHRDPMTWQRFLTPYRRPWMEATWSPADPLPFLSQWKRTFVKAVSREWPVADPSAPPGAPESGRSTHT